MGPSDEALMARVREGDLQAFGEIFDRHQPPVFAFLSRFFGDAATAEDVAQEVFWRVWRYRAKFDPRQRFRAWVYTIARNAAADEAARRRRRGPTFSELVPRGDRDEPDESAFPRNGRSRDTPTAAADLRQIVRCALARLPPEQRDCLILKEYDGMSYREIGAILGCSEGNARVLAHRARRALRDLLRPYLESEETRV